MISRKYRLPAWLMLCLMLLVSFSMHTGAAVVLLWQGEEEILIAGGAESPATTVGQAFTDMLVAGSDMPVTEPEEQDPEDTVEPEQMETAEPVKALEPEPVEQQKPVEVAAAVSALTSTIVDTGAEGKFVKAEKTIEVPLEVEAVVQEEVKPLEEPLKPVEQDKPLEAKPVEQTIQEPVKAVEPEPVKEIEPLKPEPPKPVETIETKPLEVQEPVEEQVAETIPVPQLRPKPLVRDPPKEKKKKKKAKSTAKKKKVKTAKKRNTATGAGGGSNVNAQKGGAKSTGRASAAGNAKVSNYPGKVARKLKRHRRYPSAARRERLSGEVVVSFTVDQSGRASSIRVARSSGSAILDKAGLDTVRRASPFPKIPPESGKRSWRFTVPLSFQR